ncbi:hypothetical protein Acr_09g0008460 [Actinidia rufa]|uniref:RING-type domain-containing protein n=1 Tax=Actinidia rufa TaxID=165716 RepID=A0A7J0F6U6_9ERIC|nr:hypothetical protein Acr_09g0008460 [Actinidia rufa]
MSNQNSSQSKSHHHPPPPETSTFTCEICIESISSTNKFRNNRLCTHPFCIDCITKYIQFKVEDDHRAHIKCPVLDCDRSLDPLSCRLMISLHLFDKWCDLLFEAALLGSDHCAQFDVRWHAGYRCEESGEMRDRIDVAFRVLAERNKWKRCPRCYHCVELVQGCSNVKCRIGDALLGILVNACHL